MKNSIHTQLKGKKILFACCPADGHFNPLTGLAKYLQDLECEIAWYTSISYGPKLDNLGIKHFPFQKAIDVNGENLEEILPQRKKIEDPIEKINFDTIHIFWSRSIEYFEDLEEIRKTFEFEALVCDNMFSAIPFVKLKMDIPVIAIGVIPLWEESIDLAPYGMALPPATDDNQLKEFEGLRNLANEVWFKKSSDLFRDLLAKKRIYTDETPGRLLIKNTDRFLQIGSPSFEYKRSDLGKNIRFIGSLAPYNSKKTVTRDWYDRRIEHYKSIVLVTQGTLEKDTAKLIIPTLEAFKDTDILVIATTGGIDVEKLRNLYPQENIIIESHIPFDIVMPYADAFITNGGYGGTMLSIEHSLPIVAAGVHEGKNEVCARIGFFEYGINLHTELPEPHEISEAVKKIFDNEKYKRNITKLAAELRTYNPNELCAENIAEVLGLGL